MNIFEAITWLKANQDNCIFDEDCHNSYVYDSESKKVLDLDNGNEVVVTMSMLAMKWRAGPWTRHHPFHTPFETQSEIDIRILKQDLEWLKGDVEKVSTTIEDHKDDIRRLRDRD